MRALLLVCGVLGWVEKVEELGRVPAQTLDTGTGVPDPGFAPDA